MITVPAGMRVLVATRPIDFRKGADGLVALVSETLGHDPFSGTVFVFRSKRTDRVKILVWDGTGLVLYWKRLEQGSGHRSVPPIDVKWFELLPPLEDTDAGINI
jgi:transposase